MFWLLKPARVARRRRRPARTSTTTPASALRRARSCFSVLSATLQRPAGGRADKQSARARPGAL